MAKDEQQTFTLVDAISDRSVDVQVAYTGDSIVITPDDINLPIARVQLQDDRYEVHGVSHGDGVKQAMGVDLIDYENDIAQKQKMEEHMAFLHRVSGFGGEEEDAN